KWRIAAPDRVLETSEIALPAAGDIPYKYALLPHVFTEDTWVQAAQILPDNPRSLHHCNMAFASLAEGFSEKNFITGYVPGGESGKVRLAKGTRLECVAHYDNSPFNPYNPDPKATVRHGPQTYHEMMFGFFFYTDAAEQLGLTIDPKTGGVRKAAGKP